MSWLELQLTLDAAEQPRAEAALEALGALALTVLDADADTPDEAAIYEPGVGATPLWRSTRLLALFDATTQRALLAIALQNALTGLAPDRIVFREVADADWTRAWMDRYRPMRFGRRLWIYPWNIEPPTRERGPGPESGAAPGADAAIVRLDPGLAFGTGTHPTTALCLEWLDGLDLTGKSVLDYGCGSGVLAIAALKLGAARAVGVDNDPQALIATRDNAACNGVAERIAAVAPGELPAGTRASVFVANILAGPLLQLAPRFAGLCAPGVPFALSGILAGQEGEILERCAACGFAGLHAHARDGWVRIDGRRG